MRSYGEYCALAQALDLLGERWTLLIIRELLTLGRCRYTDLQQGLPGIATNLLAERLRALEEAGLVSRELAPPPIATTLFQLTERGAAVKPVIDALILWGAELVARPMGEEAFRGHWLKLPLELFLSDGDPGAGPFAVELHSGEESILIEAAAGGIGVRLGRSERPDAVIEATGSLILALLTGRLPLAEARRRGLKLTGREAVLRRLRPVSRP